MPATATPITRNAQYPGDCRKGCGTRIAVGDVITPATQGYGWAHLACPERAPAASGGDTRYTCPRCHVDFTAVHFRVVRQATGQSLRHDCGEIAVYRGPVEPEGATFITPPAPRMASADADIFGVPAAPVAPRAQSAGIAVSEVLDGRYTVVLDSGERRTIRLAHGRNPTNSEVQFVSYLSGSNNETDYAPCANIKGGVLRWNRRFIEAHSDMARDTSILGRCIRSLLSADADQRAQYGMEYAIESGNCSRCGRTLTVPASVSRGLGPICADMGY